MSWQLGAFAILGIALLGGFAWYERARPDARIVALVATLAAFAALGRIAFAALPNVKPTTDIVLVSGYALGPALLRSSRRFPARLQVTWQPVAPALVAVVVLVGVIGAGAARAGDSPTSYLLSTQNSDGGFGSGPGQSSDQLFSGWAALGLAAQGINPQRVVKAG